jgi:hypothetical protein
MRANKKYRKRSGISAAKYSVAEYLEHIKEINENKKESFMHKSKKYKNEGLESK